MSQHQGIQEQSKLLQELSWQEGVAGMQTTHLEGHDDAS